MSEGLGTEIKRKIGRVLSGTVLIVYGVHLHNTYGIELVRSAFFFLVVVALIIDFFRVEFKVPFIQDLFPTRPLEKTSLHGTTLAGIGCLLALAFFDFDIALSAIAISIYGDSMAAIFGTLSGRTGFHTFKDKTIAGSLAMIITAIIVGLIFLKNIPIIIVMAIVATLLEMLIKNLPDDLLCIVFTALTGQLAAVFFASRSFPGGFSNALTAWAFLIIAFGVLYCLTLLNGNFRKSRK